MRVLTAQAMHALDAAASAVVGEVELMRRAGVSLAAVVREKQPHGRVVGLAGYGNNGGDAFAALAELEPKYERIVIAFDAGERVSAARRDAEARARAAGVTVLRADAQDVGALLVAPHLVLDGLLGVGARSGMRDEMRKITRAVNASGCLSIAIDVPTGLDATTGAPENDTITAHATVALGAVKLGLLLEPARPYVGELWFDDIGMADPAFDAAAPAEFFALDAVAARGMLPERPVDGDKRRSGAPLLLAGSEQFPGAAVLCARGAARAGAGYVTVATPRAAAPALRAHLVEQVVVTFDADDPQQATAEILDAAQRCGAIAIGPGLGLSENMGAIVRGVIAGASVPLVIDAGGLFHLAKHVDVLRGKAVVLTPHAGEFARLSGGGSVAPAQRIARLRSFVREYGVVTLLKGQATLVDDGTHVCINTTGTPALATAGTGDVLTGMIATLLSQKLGPFDAASLAAYWHGLAGQRAAGSRPIGVIAGDLPEVLAAAFPSAAPASMPLRIL
jgi:hydroxyethylthiazole kinase-like uncharacterized protein yjeF